MLSGTCISLLLCLAQPPSREEVGLLTDILLPLVKPLVDQWRRTNDSIDEIKDQANKQLRWYVMISSGSVGCLIGILGTWFAFTLVIDRRLREQELHAHRSIDP